MTKKILKKRFSAKSLIFLFALILINACAPYPTETDFIDDYDIVYTSYNDSKVFSNYTTYAIPDKIPYLTTNLGGNVIYLDDNNLALANLIRQEYVKQMNSKGYTQVEPSANPDMLLNLGVLNSEIGSAVSGCWYYDDLYYWDWYPSWDWGYGWDWGYYPCWSSYYSYNLGSLVVDLVDAKNSVAVDCDKPNSDCKLDVMWNSIINGILNDYTASLNSRIMNGIDQSFVQSPYLKK